MYVYHYISIYLYTNIHIVYIVYHYISIYLCKYIHHTVSASKCDCRHQQRWIGGTACGPYLIISSYHSPKLLLFLTDCQNCYFFSINCQNWYNFSPIAKVGIISHQLPKLVSFLTDQSILFLIKLESFLTKSNFGTLRVLVRFPYYLAFESEIREPTLLEEGPRPKFQYLITFPSLTCRVAFALYLFQKFP